MKNEDQTTSNTTPIILYGIDQHQKFRAALFPASQADIASRAAVKMNLNSVPVNTKEFEELATELQPARIYEAGKGFVPYVQKSVYGKIVALAGPGKIENANVPADDTSRPKAQASSTSTPEKLSKSSAAPKSKKRSAIKGLPKSWKDIRVGHLVIAQATKAEGWWEAIVTDVKRDILTLRWRDYPKVPVFARHRSTVALLRADAT